MKKSKRKSMCEKCGEAKLGREHMHKCEDCKDRCIEHCWIIERETHLSYIFKCYDCDERLVLVKELEEIK